MPIAVDPGRWSQAEHAGVPLPPADDRTAARRDAGAVAAEPDEISRLLLFSCIINGLMLKVTISLESHEDEQTCHLNLGGLETLPAVRSARVTASN
jgi:hypothetical protein